jgi:hypothetical protein
MSQHFKSVNRSAGTLAGEAVSLLLWVTRRVFWLLLRRPLIDIVLLMLALWLITGFIGRLLAPQPVLYQPAAVFEDR